MTNKAEIALQTVKRVLDKAPDYIVAELWVDDGMTLGAFVDTSLTDLTPPPVPHVTDRNLIAAAVRMALESAAQTAYRVCAETRHVTLGDKARNAIRALADDLPPQSRAEGYVGILANSAASLD